MQNEWELFRNHYVWPREVYGTVRDGENAKVQCYEGYMTARERTDLILLEDDGRWRRARDSLKDIVFQ